MSNIFYKKKEFTEVKNQYLAIVPPTQINNISRIFKAVQIFEQDHGKELYDFTRNQIRMFLYSLRPSTLKSSEQNYYHIKRFISWAIDEGIVQHSHPIEHVNREWAAQFVNKKLAYINKIELDRIVASRINNQDKAILALLREGVGGYGFDEITNLKLADISNNIAYLMDGSGESRELTLSDTCISHCTEASKETIYTVANGKSSKKSQDAELVSNDFVIKSSITKTINVLKASKYIVYRKIDSIAKEINMPHLSVNMIRFSAMIEYVRAESGISDALWDRFRIKEKIVKDDLVIKINLALAD
jgi:hypothetical protein